MWRGLIALAFLSACVTVDPFDDVARAQQRLDARGIVFGVTRVPGLDAFLLQARFSIAEEGAVGTDPMRAALAAAPRGCRVETITAMEDGASYRVDYACT